jgi:hypothetical protein
MLVASGCVSYKYIHDVPGKPGHVYVCEHESKLIFSNGRIREYKILPSGKWQYVRMVLPGATTPARPAPKKVAKEDDDVDSWE